MIYKMTFYYLKHFKSKREALDFAIDRQIKSMRNKDEPQWGYWHDHIMDLSDQKFWKD